jgi:AraC family transcriptional regulator
MSVVDKALWVIERNSTGELNLPAIAEASGVSRAHLASAFGVTTGWPVMKYLRARRLSRAARTLAQGAPDILAVALDVGYGSHEAFTRAFRDQFGVPPERVRERASTEGLPLVEPLDLHARERPALAPPWLTEGPAVRAVGLPGRHSFDKVIGIPIQWETFMTSYYSQIPHRLDGIPIGIQKPADDEGGFDYICAAEVSTFGLVPQDLVRVELPARRYAVFEHRAHVSMLFHTYAAIWNEVLPEHGWALAQAPVLERHLPSFDPGTGEGGLQLWIPLAD